MYSLGKIINVLATILHGLICTMSYPLFIIRTTRVSNPIWFVAFISQSQCTMPNIYHLANDVLFYFYAFHKSIAQCLILVSTVEPRDLNLKSHLQGHYVQSSQIHLHPLSCCDCWHRVSCCLFLKYHRCFFKRRSSWPVGLLPPYDISLLDFCSLSNILRCCLL